MNILLVLVPVSLLLVGAALAAFFWAANDGQFEDLESPALEPVLCDDEAPRR